MLVICIAVAMAAPSLRGWNRGSQHRDAADQILTLTRYARTQAIADAKTYRLNVDTQKGTCWLTMQDGQNFVNHDTNLGIVFTIPDGARLQLIDAQGTPLQSVDFYPSGRAQIGQIRLTSSNNDVTTIECATPAEGYAVATAQEQSR